MRYRKDIRLYTFLGMIAFLFIHHHYGYFGHYGFDDLMGYAQYAKKWAEGNWFYLNEDFFTYRWGFIALVGACYQLFGMSDAVSALVPSMVFLSTILLIYKVLNKYPPVVGAIAAVLYGFDNWTAYYSDKLMPDTLVALWAFAAFVIIHHYKYVVKDKSPLVYAAVLSLVLLLGYLTKQSILLLFPVFFALFIIDIYNKKHRQFWAYTVVFCAVLGSLNLVGIYYLTGNPFARFHAVAAGFDENFGAGRSFAFCNYAALPMSVLLKRIAYELWLKFMGTGMLFSLVLALPVLLLQKKKSWFAQKDATAYWSMVLVLSLLASNFMTISYKAYMPMCPDIRHFLFLVPIAVVVGAPFVYDYARECKSKHLLLVLLFLVVAVAEWMQIGNMKWLYRGLLSLVLLRMLLPNKTLYERGFYVGLAAVMLMPVLSSMRTASKNHYIEQRHVVYNYLKPIEKPSIVITNIVQRNFGTYYMEFDTTAAVQFYTYAELITLDVKDKDVYLLTNTTTEQMSGLKEADLPQWLEPCQKGNCPEKVQVVYQSNHVALYKLSTINLLESN